MRPPGSAPAGTLLGTARSLLARHDLFLLDLDGTVYVGAAPVVGAAEAVLALQGAGRAVAYLTNNAARTPEEVAAALRGLGVPAGAQDVVTSAQAAAAMLAAELPPGSPVLVVGARGLQEAVRASGLVPVAGADDEPAAVVQGYGPEVGWRQLTEASLAVGRGVPYVATNLDLTLPTPRGLAPGNGSLVQVVRGVTGVEPRVAGKPERPLVDAALARLGGRAPLVVGDRLDTDVACAVRAGLPSLLVLTGVAGPRDLVLAVPQERPTYVSQDPRGLLVPHLPAVHGRDGWWTCGSWAARVEGGRLRLLPQAPGATGPTGPTGPTAAGGAAVAAGRAAHAGDLTEALRAACGAAWTALDAGERLGDLGDLAVLEPLAAVPLT